MNYKQIRQDLIKDLEQSVQLGHKNNLLFIVGKLVMLSDIARSTN